MKVDKLNSFKLEEVNELLKDIAQREKPFWGETSQTWHKGKVVLFKEAGTKIPNS